MSRSPAFRLPSSLAIAWALLGCFSFPLRARDPSRAVTQYIIDVWKMDQGLPQDQVTAIAQTDDGYLWLGSEEGLVRFDGVQFTLFDASPPDGIAGKWIVSLCRGRNGGLWIGGLGDGLYHWQDGRFRAYASRDGLSNPRIRVLAEDGEGSLWIGTEGSGLSRRIARTTPWT